jgi:hypothetical protein
MDVGEATSLSLGHVAAFNSARPSAKARSSRPRLERLMCKAHALKEGSSGAPFQVGGKKRGYANEIVGASLGNKSVTLLTGPKENPRRKKGKTYRGKYQQCKHYSGGSCDAAPPPTMSVLS